MTDGWRKPIAPVALFGERLQMAREKVGQRWAILIGADGYHESLGPLRFCASDARLLRDTLTAEACGFPGDNTLLMADGQPPDRLPTFTNIHAWLRTWLSRAKEDDLVLIYFAGHGRVHKGKPLLVPEDATLDTLDVSGIPVDYVQEMLLRCKAKQKVLVLDACHSGAGRDVATMTADFREAIASGEGIYTMASCDEAELSHEWPEKGQGAFTHFLAEALAAAPANAQGLVTLDAVYSWVQDKVQAWAAARRLSQNPVRICRTRGEIGIAQRTLTTEQRLQQALAEITSLKQTIEAQTQTIRQLEKELAMARGESDTAPSSTGSLELVLFPPDVKCKVFVDYRPAARLDELDLEPGCHTVIIAPQSMEWGIRRAGVRIQPGDTCRRTLRLRRVLHSRVLLSFAAVLLYGCAVAALLWLLPGDSFQDWDRTSRSLPQTKGNDFAIFAVLGVVPSVLLFCSPIAAIGWCVRGRLRLGVDGETTAFTWWCGGIAVCTFYLAFGLAFAFPPNIIGPAWAVGIALILGVLVCLVPGGDHYRTRW